MGRDVFVLEKDPPIKSDQRKKRSRYVLPNPARWALNDILEKNLGVRWLWPGDIGMFVPKHDSFEIPVKDVASQPKLLVRELALGTLAMISPLLRN
jgi:hypothetical protein